jgi:hypothetical protein
MAVRRAGSIPHLTQAESRAIGILARADSGDIVPSYIEPIRLEVCNTGEMLIPFPSSSLFSHHRTQTVAGAAIAEGV